MASSSEPRLGPGLHGFRPTPPAALLTKRFQGRTEAKGYSISLARERE